MIAFIYKLKKISVNEIQHRPECADNLSLYIHSLIIVIMLTKTLVAYNLDL